MIHIAICDDCIEALGKTARLVDTYLKARPKLEASVRRFQSSYDLLDAIEARGRYDLYLLDILMPGSNGIEVGEAIRQKDAAAVILYLTSSKDFAVDSYSVRARGYLLKPFDEKELFPLLTEILGEMVAADARRLIIHTQNKIVTAPYNQILYVQYYNHRLVCRLADDSACESITLRESFTQAAAPLLQDGRFLQISSSDIVNMQYVRSVSAKSMLMADGKNLTVTRSFSHAKQKYMGYILERGTME